MNAGKNANRQYLDLEAKMETPLFSQTFEVAGNKELFFFHFWPLGQDIDY